jgi:hypothetical protein
MDQGLAMTYGMGEGQNTTHYYAGTINKPKKKEGKMVSKPKAKPKPKPSK